LRVVNRRLGVVLGRGRVRAIGPRERRSEVRADPHPSVQALTIRSRPLAATSGAGATCRPAASTLRGAPATAAS
jgi:hypothetical protein